MGYIGFEKFLWGPQSIIWELHRALEGILLKGYIGVI